MTLGTYGQARVGTLGLVHLVGRENADPDGQGRFMVARGLYRSEVDGPLGVDA